MLTEAKELWAILKKSADIEAQKAIVELQELEISLRRDVMDLREENAALKKRLELQAQLEYEAPHYWRRVDDKRDGPFCQLCFDKNTQLVRLHKRITAQTRKIVWDCMGCKNTFRIPS